MVRSSSAAPPGSWWAAFAVVLVVYAIFGAGTSRVENPGEQSRLELAAALSSYGSLSIDSVAEVYGYPYDRAVRFGKSYTDKAPGISLAGTPVAWSIGALLPREGTSTLPSYWALRHLLVLALIALPAALFPFLAMRRYSGLAEQRRAPFALVFALCTPLLTYAGVLLSHIPAGLLAALAFVLTLRPGEEILWPSPRAAGLGGLALAAAVTTEYPTALFGLVLGATMLLRRVPTRTLAVFALGFAIGMVPCLVYHELAFGSPLSTGYSFKNDPVHSLIHGTGLLGVTLPNLERLWGVLGGAKRGVFFYCPLLLLIPLGWRQMEKARKHSSLPFVALSALYVLFAAGFVDWQAGWSAAARHLLPAVVLSIFPVAAAVEYLVEQGRRQWLLLLCVALSLTGTVLSVSLTPFFPEHFSSPLGQLVLPSLSQGFAAPTLLASANLSARGYAVAGAAVLVTGATLWAVIKLVGTTKPKALAPVAVAVIALLYAGFIWGSAQPLAQDQKQMRGTVLDRIGYGSTERGEW